METVFNHTAHKALWNWLSKPENAMKIKEDWPEWKFNGGNVGVVFNLCFACEYAQELSDYNACRHCPLIWPNNNPCREFRGLYAQWCEEHPIKRTKLAAQIRDLPVKQGVKCI